MEDDKTADALELVSKIEEMVRIKQPLFVSKMNDHGQIVVLEWVRKRYNLRQGDEVAVYQIEKVE